MMEWVISSSVLIVVVLTLRFLFRGRISSRLQYALWGLVLLRLLMPFSLTESPFSVMHMIPDSSIGEKQVYVLPLSQEPLAEMPGIAVNHTGTVIDTNSFGYSVLSQDGTTITRYAKKMTVIQILTITWLIGALLVGLWFTITNLLFYRRLQRTRQEYLKNNASEYPKDYPPSCTSACNLPVYVTGDIASPCLFGIISPAVYLTPKAVQNEEHTQYALTHELCHYRHGDHIWAILRCLCLAIWWWNPLVWAAAIFSRQDSELACDEAVIRQIGQENRLAYGYILVDMIAVRKAPTGVMCAATTMTSGQRGLKGRLNMIIKRPKTVIPVMAAVLLILSLCAGCTFTSASTGGGDQGLAPLKGSPSYALFRLKNGEVLSSISPLSGDNAKLAEDTVMNYMIKSAAWPGNDINTLEECLLVRATYADSTTSDFYAYMLDGKAVMQGGKTGLYSVITPDLYEKLFKLASTATTGDTNQLIKPNPNLNPTDRTNLDACVANAILTNNINHYKKGDFSAEAHTVLKTVEKGNTTTVYAMALYMEFGYAGAGFSNTGGSHMPVAITFEKNTTGEYTLKEYWIPKDGSDYGSSIKNKFPSDIYRDALDTQKYILAHTQACYEQAIQYGQVPTNAVIARLIEIITSSPAHMSSPKAYIEAHGIEYRELIYYKNYTLRYCFKQFEQGGQTGLDGHIMAAACRDIMGKAESLEILADTGQDWYNAFKKSAQSLRQEYGDAYMEKNKPGSWLLLQVAGT